jgi:hypothetical protein
MMFVATKNGRTNKFFTLLFCTAVGSGIRYPISDIRDSGSGMDKNQDPG